MSRKKRDIDQVDAVADEFGMDQAERHRFGDYIEECKLHGDRGTGTGGEFTYAELREKAREFRGEA